MTVVSVVFDIGETLLDDSREFGAWADWIGVPRHTFSAVLGAVTAAGRDNAETFQYFRPGFDLAAERQRREDAGRGENYGEADLYPDVRPALAALRELGLWVGIAGNQTARAGRIFRKLELSADLIATSAEWGVAKPDPAFFRQDHQRRTRPPRRDRLRRRPPRQRPEARQDRRAASRPPPPRPLGPPVGRRPARLPARRLAHHLPDRATEPARP